MAFTIETLDRQLARIDALGQALISRDKELDQTQQSIAQERNDIARQVLHLQGQAAMVHMLKEEDTTPEAGDENADVAALTVVPQATEEAPPGETEAVSNG